MASPDVQVIRSGPVATPLNYTLPSTAGLQPLAITAVFDGTSAAGSFLPCVEIIGASGTVIARTAADTTISAGGGAEVSWFPGVKNAAAAGTTTTPAASAYLWTQTTQTFVGTTGFSATWDHFQTTDTTVFATAPFVDGTGPPNNHTGDVNLVLLKDGAYVLEATAQWGLHPSAIYGEIQLGTLNYVDDGRPTNIGDLASTTMPMTTEGAGMTQSIRVATIPAGDAPNFVYFLLEGQTVGNYSVTSYSMVCHYLGGGIGADHFIY